MLVRLSLFCAALTLASCHRLPFDTDGSLKRIHEDGHFNVGVISGDLQSEQRGNLLVTRVARKTGAHPVGEYGAAESLLQKLEQGELDLVIGPMAEKSPWRTKVHFLPSLSKKGVKPATMAMARDGENAWISLMHLEAEKVSKLP